jgi:predicted GIY-YIG superfamily endonuclease
VPLNTERAWQRARKVWLQDPGLVWYELHDTMIEAITREKQIKVGSRAKKIALIEALNPEWKDLYESLA